MRFRVFLGSSATCLKIPSCRGSLAFGGPLGTRAATGSGLSPAGSSGSASGCSPFQVASSLPLSFSSLLCS